MNQDTKKAAVKRMYDYSFAADMKWNRWFFDTIYRDEDVMVLEKDEKIVSSLFLQPYIFSFHEQPIGFAYISGATTESHERHKGYMTELLKEALLKANDRGDALVGLVPADTHLFFFYDKLGFATIVYCDTERYTSAHTFAMTEGFTLGEPTYDDFAAMESMRRATVIHSRQDFDNILYDINHDDGVAVAVHDAEGLCRAMAFATATTREIHVKELLGSDPKAIEMALGHIKDSYADPLPILINRPAAGNSPMLRARGMLRIVSVEKILEALAAAFPNISRTIRVHDAIVEDNNRTYRIGKGLCEVFDYNYTGKLDLDVSVTVLTKILFSDSATGSIFELPTARPAMSLMLD